MEDLNQSSELVFPNDKIKNAVEDIIKQEGFITYKMDLTAGSNVGDNFLGVVYRATVTGQKSKDGKSEQLKLICKLSPTNPIRREKFSVNAIFKREVLFYNEILPLMTKLQEDSGIVEDKFNYVPYVYATSDEEMKEFLIMKDLREDGYTMFNRFEKIDLAHSELVMSALGRFHALSFALRDKHPEIFEKYKELKDIEMMEDEMDFYFIKSVQNAIDSLNANEVELANKIEPVKLKFGGAMKEVIEKSKIGPYSVITHADTWFNNMMFKYENGVASDIKLLDWQTCRYASPVLDVLHFIFVCTENPFRLENYEKLLKIYHDSLSNFLIRLQCDPEKLFPYSALQDHLQKFGVHGLFIAIFFVEVLLQKNEDVMDMDEIAEQMDNKDSMVKEQELSFNKVKDAYNVRMSDIIRHIDQLGYFDSLNVSEKK